jgi:thiosulfate/3-mercaptopyruvate sulfurtransferase
MRLPCAGWRAGSQVIAYDAGRVPGAVNHPFGANLDPGGRFLDAELLRRRWQQRLVARPPGEVVAVAGLHGARLYAGSWSEWIPDAARPVATGGEP